MIIWLGGLDVDVDRCGTAPKRSDDFVFQRYRIIGIGIHGGLDVAAKGPGIIHSTHRISIGILSADIGLVGVCPIIAVETGVFSTLPMVPCIILKRSGSMKK
ncbi:MAG: hypothetical protein MI799_18580 [Desulfobacterales bacterium]|nr:hypothetical protein [Desulfobacterales bacterium]